MVYNTRMFDRLKALFEAAPAGTPPSPEAEGRRAAAALMLILARSDERPDPEEEAALRVALRDGLGVPEGELNALLGEAEEARAASIDLFAFTNAVKAAWPREERRRVLVHLWRVVFADGRLDRREDHLMHSVGDLLGFSHRELIEAKLEARGPAGA
jgi:uncharacterized tellurite resistance protein B-like protein